MRNVSSSRPCRPSPRGGEETRGLPTLAGVVLDEGRGSPHARRGRSLRTPPIAQQGNAAIATLNRELLAWRAPTTPSGRTRPSAILPSPSSSPDGQLSERRLSVTNVLSEYSALTAPVPVARFASAHDPSARQHMYQEAIKLAQAYTLPVVISFRREDNSTGSVIGSFIVLNEEGWILNASHIVEGIMEFRKELDLYNDYLANVRAIDLNMNNSQRKKALRSLAKPTKNSITSYSPWWARDDWRVDTFHLNKLADIAIGRIDGFDKGHVRNYPEFKNPSVNFDVGEGLCKLGFPFHNIVPLYDKTSDRFQLPDGALPIPLFPIEGIFTARL